MIILQDSQIKKIFHNGDEVKKILDWDGNVIFYKQSGGGGMTNDIKFTTSPSVSSANVFTVTYTDSTQDTLSYSEPSKEYSLSIPTDKIVNKIDFDNTMVDEVKVSCKVNLSKTFFTNKPKTIRLLNCDATSSTSLEYLFNSATKTETIEMKNSDFSNVTNMSSMFYDCIKLTSLDLSNFNTSNVTAMRSMFGECNNLTSLDLSNFNTSNVTNMGGMFENCNNLTSLDLSNFNTSNVFNISSMFYRCSNLTSLDLSNFNIRNGTNMGAMFYYCNKLTTIKMIGCNQMTIDKIKDELKRASILNNVTIITE